MVDIGYTIVSARGSEVVISIGSNNDVAETIAVNIAGAAHRGIRTERRSGLVTDDVQVYVLIPDALPKEYVGSTAIRAWIGGQASTANDITEAIVIDIPRAGYTIPHVVIDRIRLKDHMRCVRYAGSRTEIDEASPSLVSPEE